VRHGETLAGTFRESRRMVDIPPRQHRLPRLEIESGYLLLLVTAGALHSVQGAVIDDQVDVRQRSSCPSRPGEKN
jgi:hypothetical protein